MDPASLGISVSTLKNTTVAIDPGHGGIDGGTYHEKTLEKDLNLAVSLALGNLLKELGIKVAYTRTTDIRPSLEERAAIINRSGADLMLCIHHNATDDGPRWDGTETLYRTSGSPEGGMDGKKLAALVQEEVVNALGTTNNGLIYSPKMVVLRLTHMPGVIAEMGYISSDKDRRILEAPGYTEKVAEALKRAVLRAIAAMK